MFHVYSLDGCHYSMSAERLLKNKKLPHTVYQIGYAIKDHMKEILGNDTYPHILFIENTKKNNKPAVKKNNKAAVKKNNKLPAKKNNKSAVKKNNKSAVKKNNKSAVKKNNKSVVKNRINLAGGNNNNNINKIRHIVIGGFADLNMLITTVEHYKLLKKDNKLTISLFRFLCKEL